MHFKKKCLEDSATVIWLWLLLYLQCIAAIACAEIPNRQWLEVTDLLQTMVVTAGNTDALKEQALKSIGYICEDIVSIVLDIQLPKLKGVRKLLSPHPSHVEVKAMKIQKR